MPRVHAHFLGGEVANEQLADGREETGGARQCVSANDFNTVTSRLNLFLRRGKTAGISIKTPSLCCIKPSRGLDIYSAAERLSLDTQVAD